MALTVRQKRARNAAEEQGREMISDITESNLRAAIAWALRQTALPLPRPNPPRQPSKLLRSP